MLNPVALGWALWEWEKNVVTTPLTPLPSKGQAVSPKVAAEAGLEL